MNSRKVNWLFLCLILENFLLLALLLFLARGLGRPVSMSIAVNLLLGQALIMTPALIFALVCVKGGGKGSFNSLLGFRKIKPSTFFMVILFTFLLMPMSTVINAISMLFVDNTVNAISGEVLQMPFLLVLFLIGIFGPFCEEFVFRGIIFRGYKNSGPVFWAVLWSALLFALMHLNFNQAAYAFALGLMFALLVEATGSLWSSVTAHMIFNSQQVCTMYLSDRFLPGTYADSAEALTKEMLIALIGPYLIVAVIATALAVCVLIWIAKNENRDHMLSVVWARRKERQGYFVSIPLIFAIVLSLAYMSLDLILQMIS